MKGKAKIIRADGAEESFSRKLPIREVQRLIGAPEGLDTVNLRDGHVMFVGDESQVQDRPVNKKATEIFQGIYPLAKKNGRTIHGDVAIVWDEDYA